MAYFHDKNKESKENSSEFDLNAPKSGVWHKFQQIINSALQRIPFGPEIAAKLGIGQVKDWLTPEERRTIDAAILALHALSSDPGASPENFEAVLKNALDKPSELEALRAASGRSTVSLKKSSSLALGEILTGAHQKLTNPNTISVRTEMMIFNPATPEERSLQINLHYLVPKGLLGSGEHFNWLGDLIRHTQAPDFKKEFIKSLERELVLLNACLPPELPPKPSEDMMDNYNERSLAIRWKVDPTQLSTDLILKSLIAKFNKQPADSLFNEVFSCVINLGMSGRI